LAGFIFAIGLASVAWASLVGSGRRIRLIFLLIALASLIVGFVVIIEVVIV
jgi:hypothetical protein